MATIEHVALFAADPASLKDFYIREFGLRVVLDNGQGNPPGYFLADEADMALEIIGRPAETSPVNPRYVCHVCFVVEDVDQRRAELEAVGMVFEEDTVVANGSMTTAFFRDPEGNRIQIVKRWKPLIS
jgi:catechol 2,3-dioxygenase-like lactoylglutathione lyase family enzyme